MGWQPKPKILTLLVQSSRLVSHTHTHFVHILLYLLEVKNVCFCIFPVDICYLIYPEKKQLHSYANALRKKRTQPHTQQTIYLWLYIDWKSLWMPKLQSEKVSIAIEKLTTWHTTNTWVNSSNNTVHCRSDFNFQQHESLRGAFIGFQINLCVGLGVGMPTQCIHTLIHLHRQCSVFVYNVVNLMAEIKWTFGKKAK